MRRLAKGDWPNQSVKVRVGEGYERHSKLIDGDSREGGKERDR